MSMETNLQGRLRNTSLPNTHGLMPVFEAVVNSIHSIEEAGISSENGSITVEIIRDGTQALDFKSDSKKRGPDAQRGIVGFKIFDNGIGFTDANMKSFLTLDSEYKAEKGGRGVGRLLWLKAFRRVYVDSIYQDNDGKLKLRRFLFSASAGVEQEKISGATEDKTTTCVNLDKFEKKYRDASLKTTSSIADSLFEHCLWYFVRAGGAPKIIVKDEDESISLEDVYHKHMVASARTEKIIIKDKNFDLTHIKLRMHSSQAHLIAFCADSRVVKEENITGKIPGLYGRLHDDSGEFVYACYVGSDFLDENVRSERTGFDISESEIGFLKQSEITFGEIKEVVIAKAAEHLAQYLEANRAKSRERVEKFVSQKAPRYRSVLARIPEDKLLVDPNISDKELDLTLHKQLAEIEEQLLATGHDVMNPKEGEEFSEYQKRLQEYLRTAEDIKKSDLANYVSHRKVILDILEKAIQRDKQGKYVREDIIHNLIMPMGYDSNELAFDNCNLWIIDERLAFHNYLASDIPLRSMPITGCSETKEPDICALNVFDNPVLVSEGEKLPLASIVVIEIKRPMRNDAAEGEEKDPIEQALGYLERIRNGEVRTALGRPIPQSNDIPGFCYVICDITPSIKRRCTMHDAIRTSDGLGYFFYHANYCAYVEVISFDRLVNGAKERNRAFFDKLGLPTT
jgi:hypothetical protein